MKNLTKENKLFLKSIKKNHSKTEIIKALRDVIVADGKSKTFVRNIMNDDDFISDVLDYYYNHEKYDYNTRY